MSPLTRKNSDNMILDHLYGRVVRSLRLNRCPTKCWQQLAGVWIPARLLVRAAPLRNLLGIRVQQGNSTVQVRVPPGDLLFAPIPARANDLPPLLRRVLVSNWLAVSVLDQYNAGAWLDEGMTAIDVGAHIGAFSLLASRLVGGTGRVIAVEPVPENALCLRKMVEANMLTNIKVVEKAAGDRSGVLSLSLSPDASGHHSAVFERSDERIHVSACTIDELVEDLGLDAVDFLKIDAEGYEPNVLRGAQRTVERFRPVIAAAAYHLAAHREQLPRLIHDTVRDYEIVVKRCSPGLELHCFAVPREQLSRPPRPGRAVRRFDRVPPGRQLSQ